MAADQRESVLSEKTYVGEREREMFNTFLSITFRENENYITYDKHRDAQNYYIAGGETQLCRPWKENATVTLG